MPPQPLRSPDEFPGLRDRLPCGGLGLLLDWVPGHFQGQPWPAFFDGCHPMSMPIPRIGEHQGMGHLIFKYAAIESATSLVAI